MSGGGGQTTTSRTSGGTEPWKPSQDGLKYGINEATNLFKAGIGAQPYTGSTVVPYSQQTMGAMGTMGQKANAAQGDAMKPWQAYSQQMDVLSPIARGDFSNDTSFNATLGRAQQDAANQVNMGAAAAGRYGSAIHQGNVAREVGDLTNRAQLERQNWANNAMLATGAAMPGAYQTAFLPEQTQMQIGAMNEDLMSRTMQDQMRIYDAQQNAPWDALARYNAILTGAGQLGGTTRSTTTTQQPAQYGQMFGNAISGLGYGAQQGYPGLGLLGGILGGF